MIGVVAIEQCKVHVQPKLIPEFQHSCLGFPVQIDDHIASVLLPEHPEGLIGQGLDAGIRQRQNALGALSAKAFEFFIVKNNIEYTFCFNSFNNCSINCYLNTCYSIIIFCDTANKELTIF